MAEDIKFPNNGYNIKVVTKEDILKTINDNILDKEVAIELIKQLELDAAKYLRQDKWVGIPLIGNIRVSPTKYIKRQQEADGLFEDAKEILDKDKYIIFRKQVNIENKIKAKAERYYKYITSIAIAHNQKRYKHLLKYHKDYVVRLIMFFTYNVTAVDNEYQRLDND